MELMAISQDGSFRLPIMLLSSGTLADQCPITQEAMGASDYTCPWYKQGLSPCPPILQPPYEQLCCMRVVFCGHEFDARGLLLHFMRNGMSCPLCRHGRVGCKLNVGNTFPSMAPWVLEAEQQLSMSSVGDEARMIHLLGLLAQVDATMRISPFHIIFRLVPPEEEEEE